MFSANKKHAEKEIIETMPSTIASKKIFKKEVKDF